MNRYNIAIIGAGAAGCMAAISASKNDGSVILIERNHEIGKKILATGNGRCNITNINASPINYFGADKEFIKKVLNNFTVKKTIESFASLGLMLKEEDRGRMFPMSDQAKSVVNALLGELEVRKVVIKTDSLVRKIEKNESFIITLENGNNITADKLIITTGGSSAFQFGSSGDGYYWAKTFGHKITPIFPSLVPIEIEEEWIRSAQGIKVTTEVTTLVDGMELYKKSGDLLFTHFGISGPAAMSQARFVAPNIGKNIKLVVDLFPEESTRSLDEKVRKIIELNGAKSIKNSLSGIMQNNLIEILISNLNLNPEKKSAEFSKNDRLKIVNYLKKIPLTPKSTRPFKESQVTSGGIDTSEINPLTMESKIIPNLYFAGEILDIDGESGGYNLQWAWSSGYIAGKSATK